MIGSAVRPDDPFDPSGVSADRARERVLELLELTGRTDIPAPRAPNAQLTDRGTPQRSEAAEAIVAEAMREDTDLPLYVVFGASLTQLASAYLIEPRIAERLTAVWIGGPEYPGTPPAARPAGGRVQPQHRHHRGAGGVQRLADRALAGPAQRLPADADELGRAADPRAAAGRAGRVPVPPHRRRARARRPARLRLRRDLHRRRQPAGAAHRAAVVLRARPVIEPL